MSAEDRQNVATTLAQVQTSLDNLNNILAPLFDKSLVQLSSQLTPLDAAKLHSAVAYSLISMESTYLQLSGIASDAFPVSKEGERIRSAIQKISETTKMLEEFAASEAKQLEQQQQQSAQMSDSIPQEISTSSIPQQPQSQPSQQLSKSSSTQPKKDNSQSMSKPKKRKQGE